MLRDPRQVAKSQENLKRIPFLSHEDESSIIVHSPEMFINVTFLACRWLLAHPDIPIHFVNFDDLIMYPDKTLREIRNFLGEGDFSKHQINPKLKRSYPEEIGNHLWEYADTIYEFIKKKEYQKIIEYATEHRKIINQEKTTTFCTRLQEYMVFNECKNCKNSRELVKNLKKRAESKKIEWESEPCIFDCLTNPLSEHISISASIEKNHWK